MPKNRRKAQRKREKEKKKIWKPALGMYNSFGFRDKTPFNAAIINNGLIDRYGGGYFLG